MRVDKFFFIYKSSCADNSTVELLSKINTFKWNVLLSSSKLALFKTPTQTCCVYRLKPVCQSGSSLMKLVMLNLSEPCQNLLRDQFTAGFLTRNRSKVARILQLRHLARSNILSSIENWTSWTSDILSLTTLLTILEVYLDVDSTNHCHLFTKGFLWVIVCLATNTQDSFVGVSTVFSWSRVAS